MWTQSNLEYLKGGVVAAQDGLARGMVKLASGVVRFGLWIESKPRRVEIAMSQDYYYGEDFVYSDRRLENFVINLFVCHGQFNLVW